LVPNFPPELHLLGDVSHPPDFLASRHEFADEPNAECRDHEPFWGFYAAQPYLLQLLPREAVWVAGIVTALMALATNAGNLAVEFLARFSGRRTTLLITAQLRWRPPPRLPGWPTRSGPCC
jgi:hypothetical protein